MFVGGGVISYITSRISANEVDTNLIDWIIYCAKMSDKTLFNIEKCTVVQ